MLIHHAAQPCLSAMRFVYARGRLSKVCRLLAEWRLFIRVRLHQVFGLDQFYLLHFELAEVEPCNWLPSALPYTYTLAAFVLLTHQVSGCGNLHILRDAKRHVVAGVLAQREIGAVRVPVLTGDGEIVSASGINHSIFAAVYRDDGKFVAFGQRRGKDHAKICVVFLVLLIQSQRMATLGGYALLSATRNHVERN